MTTDRSTHRLTRAAVAVLAAASLVAACGDDDDDDVATGDEAPEAGVEVTGAWARTSPAVATAGEEFELTYGAPGHYEGYCPLTEDQRYESIVTE